MEIEWVSWWDSYGEQQSECDDQSGMELHSHISWKASKEPQARISSWRDVLVHWADNTFH